MATLKKLNEERMSIISKLIKKEKDKNSSPVSPQFIKDFKDKILLENSALKLSIDDYKLMCRKDKVLNMMSIALNKPKDKLKKFCKYISVFEKNISKSPESIAHIINNPITTLPQDLRSIILDKFSEMLPTKYVLLDWIDQNSLNWSVLCTNPNAIDLLENNPDNINWHYLSKNPNAIDLIKKKIEDEQNLNHIEYNKLPINKQINWNLLSENPNAIDLLKERIKYENSLNDTEYNKLKPYQQINWNLLSENSNAINLLKERIEYENSLNDTKYNKLKPYQQINWENLSKNPNIINLLKERIEYEKSLTPTKYNNLKSYQKINWFLLSQNPNAIKILKKYPNDIIWNSLSANSNAINLIKKKIEDENKLSPEEYNKLPVNEKINWTLLFKNLNVIKILKKYPNNINWDVLSENPSPNAINLLKNNSHKINWNSLSANSNAINLIKKKIEDENKLSPEEYNKLSVNEKINWTLLSQNPNVINLLKDLFKDALKNNKNQYKIDWFSLSSNPNAIEILEDNYDKIVWVSLSKNPAIFKAI
jgi:hypothetical protein